MRKFIISIIAIVFVFAACSKDEDSAKDIIKQNPKRKTSNYSSQQFDVLKNVAQELAKKIAEPNNAVYLHTLIDTILADGLDEELRFFDIFNNSESRIFNTCEEISKLNTAFANIKTMLNNVGLEDNNFYGESQIYWINSQTWNGSEIPVVAFITGDDFKDSISILGYKFINGSFTTIQVNEEYTNKNATLIINFNENPYTRLPFFKNGEATNSLGETYAKRIGRGLNPPDIEKTTITQWNDPNKIYKVHLSIMRANQQYDSWIGGGSEFMFKMKFITNITSISPFAATTNSDQSAQAWYFTRSEISNNSYQWDPSREINSNWQIFANNTHIKVTEEDVALWHFDVNATVEGYIAGYPISSVQTTISMGSGDDEVHEFSLSRQSYISDVINNGWGGIYGGGGVSYLMQLSVADIPY